MRRVLCWLLLVIAANPPVLKVCRGAEPVGAADPASEALPEDFLAKLRAPFVSILEGKPFGDALGEITRGAELNLWLDRSVDRSRRVAPGSHGPRVWDALNRVAAAENCVCYPIAGVVLVGRAAWVDQTAAAVQKARSAGNTSVKPERADVAWPEVTTPMEALAAAADLSGPIPDELRLPHDLWPANRWTELDRRVAVALVLAQFDRQFTGGRLHPADPHPADPEGRFRLAYPAETLSSALLLKAARQGDPRAEARRRADRILLLGEITAHRLATNALLDAAGNTVPAPAGSAPRFTLQLRNKPAGEVLRQLAQAVGKGCRISEAARDASEKPISLESVDATIQELAEQVAGAAGLKVSWTPDLQVDLP